MQGDEDKARAKHHGECGCYDGHGEIIGGRYEKLVQPILLLLLCERSAHGYELIERMSGFGLDFTVEPTTVYRCLRRFEEHGFVTSHWETQKLVPPVGFIRSHLRARNTLRLG
ncbi:MAG: PadR family transcriptional regulator [Thermacetogeniaceae bacterium]